MYKLFLTFLLSGYICLSQEPQKKSIKTCIRYNLIDSNKKVLDGITHYYPNGKPQRIIELFLNGDTSKNIRYTEINDSVYIEDYWSNTTILYKTTNKRLYKKGTCLLKQVKEAKNYNIFFKYDKDNNLVKKSHNDEYNDPYDLYEYAYNNNILLMSETDYYIIVSYNSKPRVKLDTNSYHIFTYTFFSNGKVKTRLKTQVKQRQDYREYFTNKHGINEPVIKSKLLMVNKPKEYLTYNEQGEIIMKTIYNSSGQIYAQHGFEYFYYN